MSEITSTIASAGARQIHLRRARLSCVDGANAGQNWQIERDVIRIGAREDNDIRLTDTTVSRLHAEIVRGRDGTILRDLGSTNGTFVGAVRVKEVYLAPDTRFRCGKTDLIYSPADEIIDVVPSQNDRFEGLVGRGLAMREVFGILERVAPTDLTVLVTGETGTGKELVSRATHNRSNRKNRPFVVFDCGAAPETLVESELFGHERGAFTGAIASREGLFEVADTGTIFIDEIGELPLELQPKLLRVLEQREVRRVGSTKVRHVDVRVVAATNRNLRDEVAAGRFREDLYYRLAVVEIRLPALRERRDDVPLLVEHLLHRAEHAGSGGGRGVKSLSPEVRALFDAYHWPGNVRELNNVIERALPFTDGSVITLDALPEALRAARPPAPSVPRPNIPADAAFSSLPLKDAKDALIEEFERQYLIDLIERHDGNVSRAARTAGMDRKSITRLLKKHQIRYRDV
ncbi:MAG: sigma 54-interacting transcriptional regulator [Pseudomonadota bacterium]|nr:sigma 54-interacting transcriptional regulator [Pseudomonadota bacterium]